MTDAPAPRLIAVGGARDGVGKSTFAANFALSLLKETRKRVLVVDLDGESCGDISQLLGISPNKTMADFAEHLDQLRPEHIGPVIAVHPTGLGLLPMAADPDSAKQVTPELVRAALELVGPLCDYLVVDCGAWVSPVSAVAMEQSSGIFLLSTPDVMVLRHTKRLVDRLQGLHFSAKLIKVILNVDHTESGVPRSVAARKLERPILVALPRDSEVVRNAQMQSKPFVADQPRAKVSRVYDEFARKLLEQQVLDQLAQVARPQAIDIQGGQFSGRDALGAHQAEQIAQYMSARGSKARGRSAAEIDARTAVKMVIHKRLPEVLDLKRMRDGDAEELRKKTHAAVVRLMDEEAAGITDRAERERIVQEILDEALGLGPLEAFLSNDRITEIMVNRRDQVYIEIDGRLTLSDATFTDDAQLLAVIERIVNPIGRRIDEKSPMVDARLQDGSRVNAIIPPLAIDGPSITIRKFAKEPFQVADLIRFGSLTEEMADLLRACVEAKLNVLISGGTGSGKTTLLNVVSSFIPEGDRIVTIEDSAELQLKQPHVVRLESRPANIEGEGAVHIRDLVKNSLRMRPDRIVIGECRGAEALDMLQAMNTGHDGSLTTIHSNSPRDCISRLETLVMFAGLDLPSKAIRDQISSAIHVIVQQARLSDGSRKITAISEVTGMEGPTITLQDIFVFKQSGLDENRKVQGRYVSTGFVPRFVQKLEALGIELPKGIFSSPSDVSRTLVPRGRGRR